MVYKHLVLRSFCGFKRIIVNLQGIGFVRINNELLVDIQDNPDNLVVFNWLQILRKLIVARRVVFNRTHGLVKDLVIIAVKNRAGESVLVEDRVTFHIKSNGKDSVGLVIDVHIKPDDFFRVFGYRKSGYKHGGRQDNGEQN